MNGAELLCESLRHAGVSCFAGIPGTDNLLVYNVCESHGLRPIVVRNEQFAPMFMDGYSRISRKTGMVFTIPGPGALATLPGMLESYQSSVPTLAIVTDIPREHLDKGRGHLHEVRDLVSAFDCVTSKCASVRTARAIPNMVRALTYALADGRSRTALLHIPADVYAEDGGEFVQQAERPGTILPPDVSEAVELIAAAKRPAIFAGTGVWWSDAMFELRKFAEHIRAPVFTSVKGKGVISDLHSHSFGQLGGEPEMREVITQCDLIIFVGTRWSQRSTERWSLELPQKIVEINFRPTNWVLKGREKSVHIEADAKQTLRELKKRSPRAHRPGWLDLFKAAKAQALERLAKEFPLEMELMTMLRRAMPEKTIVVNDSTIATYWTRRYLDMHAPGSFLWPMGSGTIGWALPAALGAKLAVQEDRTNRPVVALVGDGGLRFSLPELGTMVKENLPVVIVLFDDKSYGVIGDFQRERYGSATKAIELEHIEWPMIAAAYNIGYWYVNSPDRLCEAIIKSIAKNVPMLIHYPIELQKPRRM